MIRALAGAALVVLAAPEATGYRTFPTVEVSPAFRLDGRGRNVDSIAFWEAPDARETLLFVTAKDNSLVEVWAYPFAGNERSPLDHRSFGSAPVNGVVVDQETDRLFVIVGAPVSAVSVFELPSLDLERTFGTPGASYGPEPNGALLKLPDGTKRLFVSNERSLFVYDAASGTPLDEFRAVTGLETIAADPFHQELWIPDENGGTGVYAYDPDGGVRGDPFGGSAFDSDAEGILVYVCPDHGVPDTGCGLIVVADQRRRRTDFEVFDRVSRRHLGRFRIRGVNNTDGIASTQRPLPDHPLGLFVAIDDDRKTVGVGWDVVLTATGLRCRVNEGS